MPTEHRIGSPATVAVLGVAILFLASSCGQSTSSATMPTPSPSGVASGSYTLRTDWARFHFDLANSGYNPYENVLSTSTVSGLKPAWTSKALGSALTSPAVVGGVVYMGAAFHLYAFSASAGSANCSGTPPNKTCTPLWTGAVACGAGSPAVANGVIYVQDGCGHFYAFSVAAGSANCSGTPPNKTCTPLWTAAIIGGGSSSPAVANGVVYVNSGNGVSGKLYAFSTAALSPNCSGTPPNKTCTPLWTAADNVSSSSPAVANGVVYVGNNRLYAFSAGGTTNCSGTPPSRICMPLWLGKVGYIAGSPAVAGNVVYVVGGALYALSTDYGSTNPNCSGTTTNRTCTPLWAGTVTGLNSGASPAVANGVIYVGAISGGNKLYAFDATSGITNCSGTPPNVTCTPLWSAAGGGGLSPVVANGVVYGGDGGKNLYAFSAAGSTHCSGSPPNKTCTPLWTGATGSMVTYSSPVVVNGVVYMTDWYGDTLHAFSL
jgi:PQQ-like domain